MSESDSSGNGRCKGWAPMSKPRMLLMDEQQWVLRSKWLDRILELRRRGTAILLVEQNAVEAIRLSDMLNVLRLGLNVHKEPGADISEELLRAPCLDYDL